MTSSKIFNHVEIVNKTSKNSYLVNYEQLEVMRLTNTVKDNGEQSQQ